MKRSGYDVPQVALPEQYKNSISDGAPDAAPAPADSSILQGALQEGELAEWWRLFGNGELTGLVDRGLANNPDLRIATMRVMQAKARADQARAGLMPSLSAPVGVAVQSPGGTIGDVPVDASDRVVQKTYQASIRGSWRADIWGEQSSLAEAAKFQLWQAAFERDNVQRNITASLISNYIELLSLNDRLRVARETESVLNKMLANIEARMNAAEATLIELDQQKSNIYGARTQISSLEQQRENALANIAFLTGTVPGELKLSGGGLGVLEPPHVIPALPSSLLLRRPDVRMAEARLLAADANIDVARARILPALDLSAQAGYSNTSLSGLFQPSRLFWNTIASFTASIFDGGKLASEKENAKAIHEEMVETYARTVYQAVREVETALAAIRLSGQRLDTKKDTVVAARRTWNNSAEMHIIGSVDNMALLDAERAYQHHLDEYQQARVDNLRAYIELFHALGGGVDPGEQLPGKGVRPALAQEGMPDAPEKVSAAGGVDWPAQPLSGKDSTSSDYWQVELSGLYHRSTIDAILRDLRARYPRLMESRTVHPRLQGRIEGSKDGQASWYRVYIGDFEAPEAAHELCEALKANYQRCRVVFPHSSKAVSIPSLAQENEALPAMQKACAARRAFTQPAGWPSFAAALSLWARAGQGTG